MIFRPRIRNSLDLICEKMGRPFRPVNIGPEECVELLITHNDALSNFLKIW